ncbi:MAG: hypothetical protein GF353_14180, partial [Candidatus Lokiarchaeota archaeon]|nr:hypothetical protein [Candidatus Lokiarchaeota archaeon]
MKNIKKVLFVCMGNTARSPAAKYLAKFYAKQYNADIDFDSAGFFNAFNYMQPESQDYLNKKGIIHKDFSPKIVNHSILEQNDLILTMEQSHSQEIKDTYDNLPNLKEKVFTLKEFNSETVEKDIIDPYYRSRKMYLEILKIIDENVKRA